MEEEVSIRQAEPKDASILAEGERKIAETPGRLASKPHELRDEAFRLKIEKLSQMANGLYVVVEEKGQIVAHALLI